MFHTTKSHKQGSGRARQPGAEVYYFGNNAEEDQERESDQEGAGATSGAEASESSLGATSIQTSGTWGGMNSGTDGSKPYRPRGNRGGWKVQSPFVMHLLGDGEGEFGFTCLHWFHDCFLALQVLDYRESILNECSVIVMLLVCHFDSNKWVISDYVDPLGHGLHRPEN